jgi:hypothetical protein
MITTAEPAIMRISKATLDRITVAFGAIVFFAVALYIGVQRLTPSSVENTARRLDVERSSSVRPLQVGGWT